MNYLLFALYFYIMSVSPVQLHISKLWCNKSIQCFHLELQLEFKKNYLHHCLLHVMILPLYSTKWSNCCSWWSLLQLSSIAPTAYCRPVPAIAEPHSDCKRRVPSLQGRQFFSVVLYKLVHWIHQMQCWYYCPCSQPPVGTVVAKESAWWVCMLL